MHRKRRREASQRLRRRVGWRDGAFRGAAPPRPAKRMHNPRPVGLLTGLLTFTLLCVPAAGQPTVSPQASQAPGGPGVWLQGWTKWAPVQEVWVKVSTDGRRILYADVSDLRSRCTGDRPNSPRSAFLNRTVRVTSSGRFSFVKTLEQPGGDLTTRWRGRVTQDGARVEGTVGFDEIPADRDFWCSTGQVPFSASVLRYEGLTDQGQPVSLQVTPGARYTVSTTVRITCTPPEQPPEYLPTTPYTVEQRISGPVLPPPLTSRPGAPAQAEFEWNGSDGGVGAGVLRVPITPRGNDDRCGNTGGLSARQQISIRAVRAFPEDDRPKRTLPRPGAAPPAPSAGGFADKPFGSWFYDTRRLPANRLFPSLLLDTYGKRLKPERKVRLFFPGCGVVSPIELGALGSEWRFHSLGSEWMPVDPASGLVALLPMRTYYVGGYYANGKYEGFAACGPQLFELAKAIAGDERVFEPEGLITFLHRAMTYLATEGRVMPPAFAELSLVGLKEFRLRRDLTPTERKIIALLTEATRFETTHQGHG
jgi:hypothetical protein